MLLSLFFIVVDDESKIVERARSRKTGVVSADSGTISEIYKRYVSSLWSILPSGMGYVGVSLRSAVETNYF